MTAFTVWDSLQQCISVTLRGCQCLDERKRPLEQRGVVFCAVRSFRADGVKKQRDVCVEMEEVTTVSDHVLVEIGLPMVRCGKRTQPGQRERVTEHHLHVHPLGLFGPSFLFFLQLLDSLRTERLTLSDNDE